MNTALQNQPPIRSSWAFPRSALSFENLALFALPIGLTVTFNLVGVLFLSDFLVVALILALLNKKRITFRQAYLKPILLLLGLWFFGAIISDMINGSPMKNLLRGWFKIGLFAIYLTVIFTLVDGRRSRLAIAFFGYGLSQVLKTDFAEVQLAGDLLNENSFRTAWKFGMGVGASVVLCAVVYFFTRKRRLSSLVLLLFTPVHLFLGARSIFLTTFLAAFLTHFSKTVKSAKARRKATLIFVGILVAGLSVGYTAYDQMTRAGVFGEIARDKHQMQTAGGKNVLIGARAESKIAIVAIRDKPFLGHGSWAENRAYRLLYLKMKELEGGTVRWDSEYAQSNLIPSHSILFGAMVEHGMFGIPFWLFTLSLALRAIPAGVLGPKPAFGFEMIGVMLLAWDIFFSPFGAARRCIEALFICTASLLVSDDRPGTKQGLANA